jgi:SAM-dependent methyltransferase
MPGADSGMTHLNSGTSRSPVGEFFDEAYATNERYWWKHPWRYSTDPDDHPRSIITQHLLRYARSRPPGRALDLGCGEGADAIRLAKLGWTVDAVEVSDIGARKTLEFARQERLAVRVHACNALAFESTTPYDLVVCNGVLHYVEDKAGLVRHMQRLTAEHGVNVVSLWSTFTPVPEAHRVVPTFPDDEEGVVVSLYRRWEKLLLFFEREKVEASHDDFPGHVHSYIKLMARKG